MKLLADIGNRRLKWGVATDHGDLNGPSGAFVHSALDAPAPDLAAQFAALAALDPPASLWVSNVAGPAAGRALAEYARRAWCLKPVFATARPQQAGIVNTYPDPASLGGDRWAALIAARRRFAGRAVIVVDAGTAVTVDLLDSGGVFRGGVIFSGLHAICSALGARAENLAGCITEIPPIEAREAARITALARDTPTAMADGALLAVAGGINLAVARQRAVLQAEGEAHSRACRIILTGGDAERVAPLLDSGGLEISIDPQLVLRGLGVISGEPLR